ncbi:hypothetical protein HYX01_01030 [Candidatus Woesearchaeota archaeon]|nr:hypothetical protein [Candidatus Woesearchaeota archaeon]
MRKTESSLNQIRLEVMISGDAPIDETGKKRVINAIIGEYVLPEFVQGAIQNNRNRELAVRQPTPNVYLQEEIAGTDLEGVINRTNNGSKKGKGLLDYLPNAIRYSSKRVALWLLTAAYTLASNFFPAPALAAVPPPTPPVITDVTFPATADKNTPITISITATDNVKVQKIKIIYNGVDSEEACGIQTCTKSFIITTPNAPSQNYTVDITAYDNFSTPSNQTVTGTTNADPAPAPAQPTNDSSDDRIVSVSQLAQELFNKIKTNSNNANETKNPDEKDSYAQFSKLIWHTSNYSQLAGEIITAADSLLNSGSDNRNIGLREINETIEILRKYIAAKTKNDYLALEDISMNLQSAMVFVDYLNLNGGLKLPDGKKVSRKDYLLSNEKVFEAALIASRSVAWLTLPENIVIVPPPLLGDNLLNWLIATQAHTDWREPYLGVELEKFGKGSFKETNLKPSFKEEDQKAAREFIDSVIARTSILESDGGMQSFLTNRLNESFIRASTLDKQRAVWDMKRAGLYRTVRGVVTPEDKNITSFTSGVVYIRTPNESSIDPRNLHSYEIIKLNSPIKHISGEIKSYLPGYSVSISEDGKTLFIGPQGVVLSKDKSRYFDVSDLQQEARNMDPEKYKKGLEVLTFEFDPTKIGSPEGPWKLIAPYQETIKVGISYNGNMKAKIRYQKAA